MKKSVGLAILGIQALACDVFAASTVDLTIASDMAAIDITQLEEPRGSLWSIGAARNDEARATTASITYNAVGKLRLSNQVRAGVGWKASYHDTFENSYSFAVGGSFRYEPVKAPGLGLEGHAYIAPRVLNTGEAERYRELMTRITYDLHAKATVYLGWVDRAVHYKEEMPVREVEIAHGFVAGFALDF
jgi:hypothetical protein